MCVDTLWYHIYLVSQQLISCVCVRGHVVFTISYASSSSSCMSAVPTHKKTSTSCNAVMDYGGYLPVP